MRLLHIAEQNVRLDRLRHEVRRLHCQFQSVFPASVLLPQIDLGVENADHLVGRAIADGIPGKPAAADDFFPHIVRILHPEDDEIGAMGQNFPGGQIVKLKHVLNKVLFFLIDGAGFAAGLNHHADVLLADVLVLLVGINAEQSENGVR